ncbi:MAG: FAD-dependent monooxygenase [Proteobacteria bacterium]|nr:FAD-dependent monooxygenase [Pseudomonadota bacterium]
MRIAIIGGGIGGLATAACLKQASVDVTVYEKAALYARVGLGLLLLPNGMEALDQIGLGNRARELARPLDLAVLRRPDATFVKCMTLEHHLGIVRADLTELLTEGVPRETIRHSHELKTLTQTEDCVRLEFQEQDPVEVDFAIAADGVHSACRRSLFPDWRPAESRIRELVSVCHAPDLAAVLDRTFMKILSEEGGLAAGIVPSQRGRIIWFIQYDGRRFMDLPTTPKSRRRFAERLVGDWKEPIGELVDRTDFGTSYVWRTVAPTEPAPMHAGRVALVGDSAHPMPTLTSQGANTALKDGVTVAEELLAAFETGSDPVEALARYDRIRRPRIAEILRGGVRLVDDFLDPNQETSRPIPLVH